MADLINPRKDDAAVDRMGDSITESGSVGNGIDRRSTAFPIQTPIDVINVPVSTPQKDQMSSSPGRHSSIGTNPKVLPGGRPLRRFPRGQARKLRQQGLSIRAIGVRLGVPASTVADALRVTTSTKTR